MRRSALTWAAVVAAMPLGIALVAGQQPAGAVFTSQQATAGSTVYAASCASCHMADLAGRNEAPQLAGNNFMNTWRNRSTKDLFEFIQSTMPPTGESLSEAQFLAVTAYILQANGAQPGATPLAPATATAHRQCRHRRGVDQHRRRSTSRCGRPGRGGRTARRTRRRGPGAGRWTRRRPCQCRAARRHRRRDGEELHAGHRRDAAQSGSRRLADGAAKLSGVEPQPAHADHAG